MFNRKQSEWVSITIMVILIVVMLATRMKHFGSALHLPDASLAVFFLAGLYLRHWMAFLLLCGLAVVIDYWAINYQGVSSFCVTPAYFFLLPTYFVVWWAGRLVSDRDTEGYMVFLRLFVLAGLSIGVAFLISNGSFYLFSGYFNDLNIIEYSLRVARYLPLYWLSPMIYLVVAMLLHSAYYYASQCGRWAKQV